MPVRKDCPSWQPSALEDRKPSRSALPHKGRKASKVQASGPKLSSTIDEISNRRRRKNCLEDDAVKLLKIEWDAAEALAEFSCMAYFPKEEKMAYLPKKEKITSNIYPTCLPRWLGKRKRSPRSVNGSNSGDMAKDADLVCDLNCESKDVSAAECNELESRAMDESSGESIPADSTAESPSSHLPPVPLDCRSILVGQAVSKSAFQTVVPSTPSQTTLINVKVEEMQVDIPSVSPGKVSVKRKQKARPAVVANEVKVEDRDGQVVDTMALKARGCDGMVEPNSRLKFFHGKSRQVGYRMVNKPKTPLSEVEKEARRLRRVQANRESARQTIRRKQILCEELTKKAASLALENAGMKQKKRMLMQELYSLKDQNYHLKKQLGIESSSGDTGNESLQQSSNLPPLWPVNLSALQLSGLHYPVPAQSLVWAIAISQAAATYMTSGMPSQGQGSGVDFMSRSSTNDNSAANGASPGIPKSSHTSVPVTTEQSAMPSFTVEPSVQEQTCSVPNESSATAGTCLEGPDVPSDQQPESACQLNLAATDGQWCSDDVSPAVTHVNAAGQRSGYPKGSQYESITAVHPWPESISSAIVVDPSGAAMAPHSLASCMGMLAPQFGGHEISVAGSRIGVYLEGPLESHLFRGRRSSAAAAAAAEARRRRKELTRIKFLQSRALKPRC